MRIVSSTAGQLGEEAMSRMVLVMVMTDDWMAAKASEANRLVIRIGVSSRGSQWARAWSMAH